MAGSSEARLGSSAAMEVGLRPKRSSVVWAVARERRGMVVRRVFESMAGYVIFLLLSFYWQWTGGRECSLRLNEG